MPQISGFFFPVNRLSTKASTKLSTGGFSEWKFHLPGFFFRDFSQPF